MRNQAGFITIDFIFAVVLIFGLTALLFCVSLTLTTAEIVQYITFAAARNYVASHLDEDHQKQRAKAKYQELLSNKVFAPLFKNGWFEISDAPTVGDITQTIQEYAPTSPDPNLFWGAGTNFTAKILNFNIPLFGSSDPDGTGGSDFKTFMGSYLGRDVTQAECMDLVGRRWTAILGLGNGYGGASQANYVVMADDGC
jgi:hypothetical protein